MPDESSCDQFPKAETANLRPVSAGEFVSMLDDACGGPSCEQLLSDLGIVPKEPIQRGAACRLVYSILSQSANEAFEPP